jgi:hypothetical protein
MLHSIHYSPSLACFFSAAISMARKKGSVNYKNEVLIQLINKTLHNSEYGWQAVAMTYQEKTKEEALHDCADVKKHWIKNLRNNMKKPTDWTGEDGIQINRCMAIEKKIMRKTHSGMLAFSSDEGFVSSDRDTENTGRGGLEGGLTELTFDSEYNDEGNPIANPAPVNMLSILPLHCSPHSSPQQRPHAANDNEVQQQEMNVNAKGVTPAPAMDARAALRKAESTIKAQKTKTL